MSHRGIESFKAVVIAVVLLFATMAQAASRVDCSAVKSAILKRSVKYCVVLPPSYDDDKTRRYPIVYYLHGLGDNEQSMVTTGAWNLYEDLLASKRIGEFLVVSPNGFRGFYINSQDRKFRYEDFFLKEFIPAIEKKYRVKAERASRGIMGVSMGGYGAFHYAFKYPQMFVAVSTHMAALMENPPENLGESREGRILGDVFGSPYRATYYRQNSPFVLAEKTPATELKRLHIYFDVGRDDMYGFNAGNEQMHKLLERRGIAHEYHLYEGGHDFAFVMAHFEASLVMQSKAFGLTK